MEDRLIGRFGLAIGMGMSNGGELSLATQIAKIVSVPIGIELPAVIKDDSTGDAEGSDDVLPNEPSYFGGGDGGDGFGLYPLGEVVYRYKEILSLHRSLGERPRISIPYVANGRGLRIGVMGAEGTCWMGANLWRLSQFHTSVMEPSRKLGQ